jgi:hypothetical protein
MDDMPIVATAADLEMRAARIADPGIGKRFPYFSAYSCFRRPEDETRPCR